MPDFQKGTLVLCWTPEKPRAVPKFQLAADHLPFVPVPDRAAGQYLQGSLPIQPRRWEAVNHTVSRAGDMPDMNFSWSTSSCFSFQAQNWRLFLPQMRSHQHEGCIIKVCSYGLNFWVFIRVLRQQSFVSRPSLQNTPVFFKIFSFKQ